MDTETFRSDQASIKTGYTKDVRMNDAFKQIGNAVPPLLAFRLAQQISKTLKGASGP